MSLIDKINYRLIMLADDAPDASAVKSAAWQGAGMIIGWIFIAGAVCGLIASVLFFVNWSMAGFPAGTRKNKFIGALAAFVFCAAIGGAVLGFLGVSTGV